MSILTEQEQKALGFGLLTSAYGIMYNTSNTAAEMALKGGTDPDDLFLNPNPKAREELAKRKTKELNTQIETIVSHLERMMAEMGIEFYKP